MADLNKLIGIPFKLNHKDFDGCDCRGIVCLYYEYIRNEIFPFTDGKKILFRNPKKDIERMINALKTFSQPISYDSLQEGDVLVLRNTDTRGALGVCINTKQILHMDKIVGSCLTKKEYFKDIIIEGYRPCLQ